MNSIMTITNEYNNRNIVRVFGEVVTAGEVTTENGMIATFVASQDVRESSRKLYVRTLSQYFAWVKETNRVWGELTRNDILEYKDFLLGKGLSNLTISSYLTVVRKFYEWTEANKIYPNIAKAIKTPSRKQAFKKEHLTDDKSKELLNYFCQKSLRDFAIVNLLLRTGLRTIEIVRANVSDIETRNGRTILKVWGKGKDGKEDFVILSEKALEPIKKYLSTRKNLTTNAPLFASESNRNKNGRLTTRMISKICKEGMQSIGIDSKAFTAHSLRHTAAVAILNHGGTITDVQNVLRHSSPVTSQIYVESIKEELRLKNAPEFVIDNAY